MPVADFGRVVVEADVDRAVKANLMRWLGTYLAQLERDRLMAVGTLDRPRPESYYRRFADDGFPDPKLPAVLVTTSTLAGDPEVDGAGAYSAEWDVTISVVVRGRSHDEALDLASYFGMAIVELMLDQGTQGGLASSTDWVAPGDVQRVEDVSGSDRKLAVSVKSFVVAVDGVVHRGGGPYDPDPNEGPYPSPDPEGSPNAPYDPPQTVDEVIVGVEGVPINDLPGE